LNEISDDVLNHSDSSIGGLLQLSVFDPARHRVEFTVSDVGNGVPKTLRAERPEIDNDVDALLESVKSGVARNITERHSLSPQFHTCLANSIPCGFPAPKGSDTDLPCFT